MTKRITNLTRNPRNKLKPAQSKQRIRGGARRWGICVFFFQISDVDWKIKIHELDVLQQEMMSTFQGRKRRPIEYFKKQSIFSEAFQCLLQPSPVKKPRRTFAKALQSPLQTNAVKKPRRTFAKALHSQLQTSAQKLCCKPAKNFYEVHGACQSRAKKSCYNFFLSARNSCHLACQGKWLLDIVWRFKEPWPEWNCSLLGPASAGVAFECNSDANYEKWCELVGFGETKEFIQRIS